MQLVERVRGAVRILAGGNYEAAEAVPRLRSWQYNTYDANATLSAAGPVLRYRSREIVRRNAWARTALDRLVSGVIGRGIRPNSLHPRDTTRNLLERTWADWVKQCDAMGLLNFYGIQTQAMRETVESGEVLIRRRRTRLSAGLVVPLQLQCLEPDFLEQDYHRTRTTRGTYIENGIETGAAGQRVAYHLYRQHPGSFYDANIETERVLAENVIHSFNPRRSGQQRGEPWFAPVLIKLNELDKYDDAEVVRKATAAYITHVITEQDTGGNPILGTEDVEEALPEFKPGSTVKLLPGESMETSTSADVGQSYGEFMRVQLRAVASALGVTYEALTGDLSEVNYSSLRAGRKESERFANALQEQIFIHQVCNRVWVWFLEAMVTAGLIDARDYQIEAADYQRVDWLADRPAAVDPLKDAQADVLEIAAGLNSRQNAVRARGRDPETVDGQQERDQQNQADRGLEYVRSSSSTAAGRTAPSENTND